MDNEELRVFFQWCEESLRQFHTESCDESEHYYLGDVMIGGYAGDTRAYFFNHGNEFAAAVRMFDASKAAA
jgi:hypothetical protein